MTIASLVQRWVNGSVVNNGLLLESPPRSGNNEKTYYSSDFGTASYRPYLVIEYR